LVSYPLTDHDLLLMASHCVFWIAVPDSSSKQHVFLSANFHWNSSRTRCRVSKDLATIRNDWRWLSHQICCQVCLFQGTTNGTRL